MYGCQLRMPVQKNYTAGTESLSQKKKSNILNNIHELNNREAVPSMKYKQPHKLFA